MIEIANAGQSPAQNASFIVHTRSVPIGSHFLNVERIKGTTSCSEIVGGQLTTPIFQTRNRDIYEPHAGYLPPAIPAPPITITKSMIDGGSALVVDGCIRYSFDGGNGETRFCSILLPSADSPLGPGSVVSYSCGKGNSVR